VKSSRVIVALDFATAAMALRFAEQLTPSHCRLKVGLELFTAAGPSLVRELVQRDFDVFLDLKFHDIPTTVAHACKQAAELGVWMLNVHTMGGEAMLEAARDAVHSASHPPLLIGVTVLTSHDDAALAAVGVPDGTAREVGRLAGLARTRGLDGVVCSGHEAAALRQSMGRNFVLVTPGIRPRATAANDQARTMTPEQAVRAGADYLVVGRPITSAQIPIAMLEDINMEIDAALS